MSIPYVTLTRTPAAIAWAIRDRDGEPLRTGHAPTIHAAKAQALTIHAAIWRGTPDVYDATDEEQP